jgi:hypothetical protein
MPLRYTYSASLADQLLGLYYSHTDDDIAQLASKLRYLKQLAERRERAEEATERDKPPD